MVEQYSQVLYSPADVLEKLASLKTPEGRGQFLGDARARGQWDAFQKEKESTREKEKEAEAKAFAEIDWHDFAIVQTIEFTLADAQSELPFPMTVADVESMTLSQKRMAAMITENTAPEVEAHKASQAAAEAAAAAAQHSLDEAVAAANDGGEMDMDSGDEDSAAKAEEAREQEEALARARDLQQRSTELGAPMKIRKDYVPKSELPLVHHSLFRNRS
jgi:splicing factor 3A subunit 1